MNSSTDATLDVRQILPGDRHARIFSRLDALAPGQALQLVSDHDPEHLRQQFEGRSSGRLEWISLESGPQLWRVQIRRLATRAEPTSGDSCCSGGACCG